MMFLRIPAGANGLVLRGGAGGVRGSAMTTCWVLGASGLGIT